MSAPSGKFAAERVSHSVRNRINPIRGLTPYLLTQQIEWWRTGYLAPLARLWEEIEDRDVLLKGVIAKRKRDAARCRWEILTENDSPEAARQKEFLATFYSRLSTTAVLDQDQRGGVALLLRQMMDAVGKRYAVHEIVWVPKRDGFLSADLYHAPVWMFEARSGRLRFLPNDQAYDGERMPEGEWIVTVGDGLMMASCIAYMAKDLGLKDWLNYTERFGSPVVDASTNAPQGSAEWDNLVEAVANFVADGYIVRNQSAQIALLEAKGAGTLPQPGLVDYIDRGLSALWRGADLGTMSAGEGSGQGASLQGGEREALLADDCEILSETLQQRLDLPALRWKFGPDVEALAYFQVSPPVEQDSTQELAIDEFLVRSGVPLSVADTLQRYDRPQADPGEAVLRPAPTPAVGGFGATRTAQGAEEEADPAGRDRMDAVAMANASPEQKAALMDAFAQDMRPVADRLRRILTIEDPEILRAKLVAFRDELPELMRSLGADPAAAREIEAMMARAMLSGMAASAGAAKS